MKNYLSTAILMMMFIFVPVKTSYAGAEPFLGEITLFAGNFAPRGYMFCEGQMLAISSNTALFSLLGTTYGGDGRTTFKLPNLKKTEEMLGGVRYIISMQGIYPSRS